MLPTYNEAGNLARLLAGLEDVAPQLRVLVVDDDSPDGTGRIADDHAGETRALRVIHRRGSGDSEPRTSRAPPGPGGRAPTRCSPWTVISPTTPARSRISSRPSRRPTS